MELQSENINELITALVKAQGHIKHAYKNSSNPFHKSKYADLEGVINTCKPHLTENGLSVVQGTTWMDGEEFLVSTLYHTSGQWLRSYYKLSIPANAKNTEQAKGSAITYGRRYCLASLLMIAQSDDDANEIHEVLEPISDKVADALIKRVKSYPNDYQPIVGQEIKKRFKVSKIKDLPEKHFEELIQMLDKIEQELEIVPMEDSA